MIRVSSGRRGKPRAASRATAGITVGHSPRTRPEFRATPLLTSWRCGAGSSSGGPKAEKPSKPGRARELARIATGPQTLSVRRHGWVAATTHDILLALRVEGQRCPAG